MRIGLGTAAIGRPQYINIKQKQEKKSFDLESFKGEAMEMLDFAYQKGIKYFDTAPGYGLAESTLQEWVNIQKNKDIEVGTKWGYTYVADFDPLAKVHEVKEHSIQKLEEQWRLSQNLLPYLKKYQIHSATFETGVLDNKKVLEKLAFLKEKHQLHIGITTTGNNQMEVLKKALEVSVGRKVLFDTFQVTFNIFDQSLLDIKSQLKGRQLIIKEALANGRIFQNEHYSHYQNQYKTLGKLAKKYSVGVDAIALRFAMDSFENAIVLSGAAQKNHLEQNLMANDFELEPKELNLLKELKVTPLDYWKERKLLGWN